MSRQRHPNNGGPQELSIALVSGAVRTALRLKSDEVGQLEISLEGRAIEMPEMSDAFHVQLLWQLLVDGEAIVQQQRE
jgi:hypothetical protein